MFSFGKFLRRTFVVCALILSVQARESLQHKRANTKEPSILQKPESIAKFYS